MATLDEVPPVKVLNEYKDPVTGMLRSVTLECGPYWVRFGKDPNGKSRVVMEDKGWMRSSRGKPAIEDHIWSALRKTAAPRFKQPKATPSLKPKPVQFVNPQPVPVPVFVMRSVFCLAQAEIPFK